MARFFILCSLLILCNLDSRAQKFDNSNRKAIFKFLVVPTYVDNHIGWGVEMPIAKKSFFHIYNSNHIIRDFTYNGWMYLGNVSFSHRHYFKKEYLPSRKINFGYNGYSQIGLSLWLGILGESGVGAGANIHFTVGQQFQLSERMSLDLGLGAVLINGLFPAPKVVIAFGIR